MIFVASGVFCQIAPHKIAFSNHIYSLNQAFIYNNRPYIASCFQQTKSKTPIQPGIDDKPGFFLGITAFSVINADYYTQNFGFFCKKELQFEKVAKVPFKFRLGSVQYCDWMEGKKSAGILPNN